MGLSEFHTEKPEEAGQKIKELIRDANAEIQALPDDNINFMIFLSGTSKPEDDNVHTNNVMGGDMKMLAIGIVNLLENMMQQSPELALRVAAMIAMNHSKDSLLKNIEPQGNA